MPMELAVIGAGYGGPNLVRTALATPAFRLDWPCDLQIERARVALGPYTTVLATSSYDEILADPGVTAVAMIASQRFLVTGGSWARPDRLNSGRPAGSTPSAAAWRKSSAPANAYVGTQASH